MTQSEAENLNCLTSIKEIEFIILKLPTKKTTNPDSFTGEVYQMFQEEGIAILHKVFQKIEDRTWPNSSIRTGKPQQKRRQTRMLQGKIQTKIPHEHRPESLHKLLVNCTQ